MVQVGLNHSSDMAQVILNHGSSMFLLQSFRDNMSTAVNTLSLKLCSTNYNVRQIAYIQIKDLSKE